MWSGHEYGTNLVEIDGLDPEALERCVDVLTNILAVCRQDLRSDLCGGCSSPCGPQSLSKRDFRPAIMVGLHDFRCDAETAVGINDLTCIALPLFVYEQTRTLVLRALNCMDSIDANGLETSRKLLVGLGHGHHPHVYM